MGLGLLAGCGSISQGPRHRLARDRNSPERGIGSRGKLGEDRLRNGRHIALTFKASSNGLGLAVGLSMLAGRPHCPAHPRACPHRNELHEVSKSYSVTRLMTPLGSNGFRDASVICSHLPEEREGGNLRCAEWFLRSSVPPGRSCGEMPSTGFACRASRGSDR
jgi:hypothetical protein